VGLEQGTTVEISLGSILPKEHPEKNFRILGSFLDY
jgi:hypothetical protein